MGGGRFFARTGHPRPLTDDVSGALLGFKENLAHIFSDDAEGDQLDSA